MKKVIKNNCSWCEIEEPLPSTGFCTNHYNTSRKSVDCFEHIPLGNNGTKNNIFLNNLPFSKKKKTQLL